jgi:hypothetical protein
VIVDVCRKGRNWLARASADGVPSAASPAGTSPHHRLVHRASVDFRASHNQEDTTGRQMLVPACWLAWSSASPGSILLVPKAYSPEGRLCAARILTYEKNEDAGAG